LEILTRTWEKEDRLLVPKSRKLMISWWAVAVHLWLAMFTSGAYIAYQSRKEMSAANLVKRSYFIWTQLPPLRPRATHTYCKLKLPGLQTEIEGVPMGKRTIMEETCTAIFCDEAAFQEELRESYIAARPTIDGPPGKRGKYTAVSSANPGFFKDLVHDEVEMGILIV